ncbi:unnamed protein product [Lactuca saligna]|uniref:Uncharacterized protein n=1 Tax=Lactuca saligna TaxID=75948 RepID=A0AA35ZEE4_LACSI|nr:unnamed protein product [Lactuca saligna]
MDIDLSHISWAVLLLLELQSSVLMANVSSSLELVLFIGVLFLFPLFAHPLEIPPRLLLNYSPPHTTTVTTSYLRGSLAAAHEVPSGANPDSNRTGSKRSKPVKRIRYFTYHQLAPSVGLKPYISEKKLNRARKCYLANKDENIAINGDEPPQITTQGMIGVLVKSSIEPIPITQGIGGPCNLILEPTQEDLII